MKEHMKIDVTGRERVRKRRRAVNDGRMQILAEDILQFAGKRIRNARNVFAPGRPGVLDSIIAMCEPTRWAKFSSP